MKKSLIALAAIPLLFLSSCAPRVDYEQKYDELYEQYALLESAYDSLAGSETASDYDTPFRPDPFDFRFTQYGFRTYEDAYEYIMGFIEKEKGYTDPDKAQDAAIYLIHYIEELMKYCSE